MPSHLLYGQNGVALDDRLAALRAEIDPQGLSTTTIDVQSSNPQDIAAACQALPFFGGRRLVILRDPIAPPKRGDDADDADEAAGRVKWADLHAVLKSVPGMTDIIARHDGSLTPTHFMVKAATALGWKTELYPVLSGADLLAWVQSRAAAQDVAFARGASEAMLSRLYPTSWQKVNNWTVEVPDMRLIASEVDKLCCAARDGAITEQDVEELVPDRSGMSAFKLTDDVFAGRTEAALIELDNVLAVGDPPERVLAQVASEAAARASVRRAAGLPRDAVAGASGVSSNRIGGLQQKSAHLNEASFRAIAEAIRRADSAVKAGHAPDTASTIVPLVAEVAEAARGGRGG